MKNCKSMPGESPFSISEWHSCFICCKSSKFHCFCCLKAVCQHCIATAEFARVRRNKGFCNHYLKFALLQEENMDVDSDGVLLFGLRFSLCCEERNPLTEISTTYYFSKGIKKISKGDNNTQILLQVSNMSKDICISMLSEVFFSEEECEDFSQKVKDGLMKKPTIVDIELKARSLHEDITKHWIAKELNLLRNPIDRANEKGWRREFFEYMEKKQLLQKPSEQSRLLQVVPKVIADVSELETMANDAIKEYKQGDESLPKSILLGSSAISGDSSKGSGFSSVVKKKRSLASIIEELDRSEPKIKRNQEASAVQLTGLSSSDDNDGSRVAIGKQKL